MTFNQKKYVELLKYEEWIKENFKQSLLEYDEVKYYELQDQLSFIKNFIIFKKYLPQYLKLFKDFLDNKITSKLFIDEFYYIFNEQNKSLEKQIDDFAEIKNLKNNYQVSSLSLTFYNISIKLDIFDENIEPGSEIFDKNLKSYINEQYNSLKMINFE